MVPKIVVNLAFTICRSPLPQPPVPRKCSTYEVKKRLSIRTIHSYCTAKKKDKHLKVHLILTATNWSFKPFVRSIYMTTYYSFIYSTLMYLMLIFFCTIIIRPTALSAVLLSLSQESTSGSISVSPGPLGACPRGGPGTHRATWRLRAKIHSACVLEPGGIY